MKRIWNVMALLGCMLWSTMVDAQQTFVVQGQIDGLKDGSIVSLIDVDDLIVQTDTVCAGRFFFQGTQTEAGRFELSTGFSFRSVWLQNGDTLTCTGTGPHAIGWSLQSDNPLQIEELAYDRVELKEKLEEVALREQMEDIKKRMEDLSEEEKKVWLDTLHSLDVRIDSLQEHEGAVKQFRLLKQRYLKDGKVDSLSLCAQHQLYSAALCTRYSKFFPCGDEVCEFYRLVPKEQEQSVEMQNIHVMLYPIQGVKEGQSMYDGAVLYDLQGDVHRLSDYNRGKYLLLDFGNLSCGLCLKAFSELSEIAETMSDSLIVISLSEDKKEQWTKASKEHSITWVNLNDLRGRADIFAHYGVNGIPHYVIISPEGKIEKVFTGYSKGRIKQKLSSIFPQLKSKK